VITEGLPDRPVSPGPTTGPPGLPRDAVTLWGWGWLAAHVLTGLTVVLAIVAAATSGFAVARGGDVPLLVGASAGGIAMLVSAPVTVPIVLASLPLLVPAIVVLTPKEVRARHRHEYEHRPRGRGSMGDIDQIPWA
jgi:hypothetical protein